MHITTLSGLQEKLDSLSHSEEALRQIEIFSNDLGSTAERIRLFNADDGIVRSPIRCEETCQLGYDKPDDIFQLLQGDIVQTDSAYFMGERITSAKYVVLSSTCDLVPNRRMFAAVLKVKAIKQGEEAARAKLNLLLKFTRRDSMYLPAMESDSFDTLCNVVEFDGICQIRSADLLLSNRIASLSLVGWQIFASFARTAIVRANPRENSMRKAIEGRPRQEPLNFAGHGA